MISTKKTHIYDRTRYGKHKIIDELPVNKVSIVRCFTQYRNTKQCLKSLVHMTIYHLAHNSDKLHNNTLY